MNGGGTERTRHAAKPPGLRLGAQRAPLVCLPDSLPIKLINAFVRSPAGTALHRLTRPWPCSHPETQEGVSACQFTWRDGAQGPGVAVQAAPEPTLNPTGVSLFSSISTPSGPPVP